MLPGAVGHRRRQLLQQQSPDLDQTWTQQRTSETGRREMMENSQPKPELLFTRVIVELLQDAVNAVLAADRALLRPQRQAGQPSPQEDRLGRHLVDLC